MGCAGPKSELEVKESLSFLDIAIKQHKRVEEHFNVKIPLLLMNSFNTHERTKELVDDPSIRLFQQSKCPRLDECTLQPLPAQEDQERWYPPGHGNIFVGLHESGLMDQLISEGRDILFISNIDNTGAVPDEKILKYFVEQDLEYAMECTEKTQADLKKTSMGRKIIQLETSIGGAIKNFSRVTSIKVPRSRFIPVKGTADLLGVCSDLYSLSPLFSLIYQGIPPPPKISLSSHFNTVGELHRRFPVWPSLRKVRSLSIQGDFVFQGSVTFEGDVELSTETTTSIPEGSSFINETKIFK